MHRLRKIFWISILCGVLLLSGCRNTEEKSDEAANTVSAEEYMEGFLEEFFSFDKESRYSSAQDMDDTFFEQYYEPLKSYITQECYEALYGNRIPLKYDMAVAEKNAEAEAEDIEIKNYEDDTYEFSVQVKIIAEEEALMTFKGQMSVTEDGKVGSFTIEEESDFVSFLEK